MENTLVLAPPSALPGISPTGGEIGKAIQRRFIRNVKEGREAAIGQSPHLWGRCPAGQRGVSHTHNAATGATSC